MPKIISPIDIGTPTDAQIELMPRAGQPAIWQDYRQKIESLIDTAKSITVVDVDDVPTMKKARETRLILRQLRIDIENYRKQQGEADLRRTQARNAEAKALREIIEPLEERLQQQENFIELENARIANEQRSRRADELTPFLSGPISVDLGTMPDAEYAALLSDMKDAHAFRKEREAREAQAAKEASESAAKEQERIKAENARLKAESEAKEAELAKERAANEAKLAAERAEAKKLADASAAEARKAQEAANAKAAAERKAREKAERELADAKRAEEQRKRDEAAADLKRQQEESEAKRKEEAAPDRAKLHRLAIQIGELDVPTIKDTALQKLITEQRDKFSAWVEKKAEEL